MSKTNREKLSDVLWSAGIFDHEYGDKIINLFDEERRIAREEERKRMVNKIPANPYNKKDKDEYGSHIIYNAVVANLKVALTTPLEDPN